MKAIPLPGLVFFVFSPFTCHPLKGQKKVFTSAHFNIREPAPGVWAAINNDEGGLAICNAGIADLCDRTVVFDPFMNIDAASDLKRASKILTGRPFGIVLNSHFHNDHIRANQLFDQSIISGTKWTRNRIAVSEPEELAWEVAKARGILEENRMALSSAKGLQKEEIGLWIAYFEGMDENSPKVRTTLPNQTFSDSLTTTCFVPGHGEQGGPLVVREMIQYIDNLKGLVSDMPMVTPESAISRIPIPDRYSQWKLRRFFPMNLSFLWARRRAVIGR